MKKLFLLIYFLFGVSFLSLANADYSLGLPQTMGTGSTDNIIGTFTTGDIQHSTTIQLKLEAKAMYYFCGATFYVNGEQIFVLDGAGTDNWRSITTNSFSIEPNKTYEIKVRPLGNMYFQNFSSTVDFTIKKPSIGGITASDSIINSNNEKNITFNLTGINDINLNDNLSFSYSFDNQNYILLDGILVGPVTAGQISFNLDLSNKPDGEIKIYFKANDGQFFFEPISITLNKDTTIANPQISLNIVELNSELGSKKIVFTSEYGDISYNINKDGKCNQSLTFMSLIKDLEFSLGSDNGKYVCYKVNFGKNQIIYHLSPKISGIEGVMSYERGDVFYDYRKM